MAPKRKVSDAQLAILISAMEQSRAALINSSSNVAGLEEKKCLDLDWCTLVNRLNSAPGERKSLMKWRTYWSELKYSVRRKAARLRSQPTVSSLNYTEKQVLSIIAPSEVGQYQDAPMEPSKPEVNREIFKNEPQSNFKTVRNCCVALVLKHGRTADLLDDTAFRELLNLIPMTEEERDKLNSVSIKEFIEDDKHSSDDSSDSDEETNEDVKTDEENKTEIGLTPKKVKIKKEPLDCSCPLRDGRSHGSDCSAIAQETWQYFELSTDEATCKLCSKAFQWTGTLDLKVHLALNHPGVVLADQGSIDDVCAAGGCIQYTNPEVTIEEELLNKDLPSTAKKRKYPATTMVTHEGTKRCLERFQSIEHFGQYIASLMKLLPVDKSLQYQEQFVQTLIREQAAAG